MSKDNFEVFRLGYDPIPEWFANFVRSKKVELFYGRGGISAIIEGIRAYRGDYILLKDGEMTVYIGKESYCVP